MAARKSNVTMLEEILWHRRHLRACRLKRGHVIVWKTRNGARGTWTSAHDAASMLLDGAPIEALP